MKKNHSRKINRNAKVNLKKDISFLKEMQGYTNPRDCLDIDMLKTMLSDWQSELEAQLKLSIKQPKGAK